MLFSDDPDSLLPALNCWRAGTYQLPAALCLMAAPERMAVTSKEWGDLTVLFLALGFEPALIQRLGATGLYEESFLNYLQRFHLSCQMDMMPESAAEGQPLACIRGPLIQILILKPLALRMIEGNWVEENPLPHAIHL